MRSILKLRKVPTIFVTAFPERLLTNDRPDPTFLITKPFQPETLVAAINQALTGTRPAGPTPAEALRLAAAEARRALERIPHEKPPEKSDVLFGHNGPPAEDGLPYSEFQITIEVLHRLENAPAVPPSDRTQLNADKDHRLAFERSTR